MTTAIDASDCRILCMARRLTDSIVQSDAQISEMALDMACELFASQYVSVESSVASSMSLFEEPEADTAMNSLEVSFCTPVSAFSMNFSGKGLFLMIS